MLVPLPLYLGCLLFVLLINTWLILLVFRYNGTGVVSRMFAATSIIITIWQVPIYLSLQPWALDYRLIFARVAMCIGVIINLSIYLLIYTLVNERLPKRAVLIMLLIFTIICFVLSLSPYVFKAVVFVENSIKTVPGPAIGVTALHLFLFILSTIYLFVSSIRQSKGILHKRLILVLYGIIGMFTGILFTIFLPIIFFHNATFVQFAPLYILIFLVFTATSILKYQLFNIKLLITEGLTILIATALVVQFFIFDISKNVINSIIIFLSSKNFEILFGVIALLLCAYLGFTVFIKNWRNTTNRLFFLLSLVLMAYIITNYLSLHPPGGRETQLFWIRIVMFTCSFIGPMLVLLTHTFPSERLSLQKKYIVALCILVSLSASASLLPLVFTSIQFSNGIPLPIAGPGMPIFLLDFVGLFIFSFILLISKYKRTQGINRRQITIFTLGVIATFSLMAITTVISVVFLKNSAPVFLGPLSSVLLMIFIAYAIVKHHIFNIKILAAEILIAFIVIILIAESTTRGTSGEAIFKIVFSLLVALLGMYLVRSVRREIAQEKELERLRTMEGLYGQIQELDRQKTEFLTIAAHQLRTPVSIINNYIAMLQDGDYGAISGEAKEVLLNMNQSNQWLVRLANEFMNISNLEQGQTKYHYIREDMKSIIDSVVVELATKAKLAGVRLVWEKPVEDLVAFFDEEKIRAVIFNFVDNAIKYGGREKNQNSRGDNSVITISAKKEKDGISLEVKDQGIGFGSDDQARFFQKFSRGKNAQSIHVNLSTGLGLYICRKFVEGHNGSIWANSAGLGKGSKFGFWIPLKHVI